MRQKKKQKKQSEIKIKKNFETKTDRLSEKQKLGKQLGKPKQSQNIKSMLPEKKINLGVNIDHVATLRQVRGGTTLYPDLVSAAQICKKAGADQITIHLREDRRHIQDNDLKNIIHWRNHQKGLSINLEMATNKEMFLKAKKFRPDWVCLVPEKREELTTEGGLDLLRLKKIFKWSQKNILQAIEELQSLGIEVSAFIEPDLLQVQCAFELGCDAVEFHTGKWVHLKGAQKKKEWNRLKESAILAESLGVRVHAGHGLDYEHAAQIKELPFLQEVNIGHSLVCYSIFDGLETAVKKMQNQLLKK